MLEMLVAAFVILFVVVPVFAVAATWSIRNLLYICGPNEVLVFSGARSRVGNRVVGYRVVKGGRAWRIPIIQKVDRMDLTNMTVDVTVSNAYSKGGIPLTVQGVANLKIAGHQPTLDNALERFLGRSREEIVQVAKDTLEGNLRGVLSQLTPEEVNQDKLAFAEKLLEEAEHDLTRLGLVLDVLKIQNVSDDVGYLDSIGRKQTAALLQRARLAEATARADAAIRDAEARMRARVAEAEARIEILKAETERRIADARTRREAVVAEERGKVLALVARAQAEIQVQQARVEQVRRRLEADVIAPARARMEAMQAEARGRAARVVEDGRATAHALRELVRTWREGGEHAREILLLQKLQPILAALAGTLEGLRVDRVTLLPPGSGGGVATGVNQAIEGARSGLGGAFEAILDRLAGLPPGTLRGERERRRDADAPEPEAAAPPSGEAAGGGERDGGEDRRARDDEARREEGPVPPAGDPPGDEEVDWAEVRRETVARARRAMEHVEVEARSPRGGREPAARPRLAPPVEPPDEIQDLLRRLRERSDGQRSRREDW